MSLAALIEELIDLKMKGEPKGYEWVSIADDNERRRVYYQEIRILKCQIDEAVTVRDNP